jgi:putative transposase
MTHQIQSTDLQNAVQLLADNGFEGMADAIQILFNEAMKIERTQYIGAEPYQRTDQRRSYANGFKPKTVNSRMGKLELKVPQTRDGDFYPSALERGERSERALKLENTSSEPFVAAARLIQSSTSARCSICASVPYRTLA